jgi:hypothetical protein
LNALSQLAGTWRYGHPENALERAFELARSGKYASVKAIREQLRREGYAQQQLMGDLLAKQ